MDRGANGEQAQVTKQLVFNLKKNSLLWCLSGAWLQG